MKVPADGQMVHKALAAARTLQSQGIEAEVVDLRTLVPLDTATVLRAVGKTGRLLMVDEDYLQTGLSAEIAAAVAERLDELALKAPERRLAVPGVSIPYSRPLEQAVIPSVARIVEACCELTDAKLRSAA